MNFRNSSNETFSRPDGIHVAEPSAYKDCNSLHLLRKSGKVAEYTGCNSTYIFSPTSFGASILFV